jgi:Glycosyltransferase family 87
VAQEKAAAGGKRPTLNSEAEARSERQWRILLWVFGFVLLVFVFVPIWHSVRGHSTKDYWVWYQTGQTVLQGGEIYPDRWHKFPFMYPPPCALFLAPVAALGKTGLVVVLALVNAAAWYCSIIFSVRLATGDWRRAPLLVYLIPSFVMGAHLWGNFLLGQPSLVLLALMLGAFISLQGKSEWVAGGLIAIAAAIKAFPVMAIVYLLYRRYWIAVGSLVLALAFFLIVLPIPFRGYPQAKQDLERWSSGMLFKYDESGVGQRLGRSTSWKNQSIWGVANRLLRHVEYDHKYEPHEPVYANFADLEFETVNRIILGCALALGLVFIGAMPPSSRLFCSRRPGGGARETPRAHPGASHSEAATKESHSEAATKESRAEAATDERKRYRTRETDAIEFALLLLLILVFTPLSFGYLFAWLLYPLTVIVHRIVTRANKDPLLAACAGCAVGLLALSIPFRVMAQTYGNALFATLLLFTGLTIELWRLKRAAAVS